MGDLRQSVTLQDLAFRYKHDQRLNQRDREDLLHVIALFAVDWLTQDYQARQGKARATPQGEQPPALEAERTRGS